MREMALFDVCLRRHDGNRMEMHHKKPSTIYWQPCGLIVTATSQQDLSFVKVTRKLKISKQGLRYPKLQLLSS